MTTQILNLPRNIPWKLIAVSPDMMDKKFCNKLFPFAWRSSLAISAYEPDLEELPEDLCEGRITYLKVTCSITGFQPTKEETEAIDPISLPDVPTEDVREELDRIKDIYLACYGALLNLAVFPYPNTKKELNERNRINFSQLMSSTGTAPLPMTPGTFLDNPYEHPTGVKFEALGEDSNRLVDIFPESGDEKAELDLHNKMVVTIPPTPGLAAVEAKLVHYTASGVTMEAFKEGESVGTQTTGLEQGQVHQILIEGEDFDRVVFTAPSNKASLLEFAYFIGRDVAVDLEDYPHIIGLEPEKRDLYQAATETGEVLTASKSGVATNKSFTDIESTESSATFGVEIPIAEKAGKIFGSTSRTTTDTDNSQWSVQTDASRERRETQGKTTQISQMYNLLTGYHKGTNRGLHLLLARPHVLQPTDYRTFVQGLRAIEGIQEFFFIVARPREIKGLCIEAYLETGHFPEGVYIESPAAVYHERFEDFVVTAESGDRSIEDFVTSKYTIETGWVINRLKGDPFHSGIQFIGGKDRLGEITPDNVHQRIARFNYQLIDDITVQVVGWVPSLFDNVNLAELKFRVFTRSQEPKRNDKQSHADLDRLLITNRGLCACFESGDCPKVVTLPEPEPPYVESIVDEPVIKMDPALLTREAASQSRMPAMKELVRKIQSAMATSWRVPSRHPFGEVGFLESDYFKDQIKNVLPQDRLEAPLSRVSGLPDEIAGSLGGKCTVDEALALDLKRFCLKTGLSAKEAAKARHKLLGITLKAEKKEDPEAKDYQ